MKKVYLRVESWQLVPLRIHLRTGSGKGQLPPDDVTALVGALVAGALAPKLFVAVTKIARIFPTSPTTGIYVLAVPMVGIGAAFSQ